MASSSTNSVVIIIIIINLVLVQVSGDLPQLRRHNLVGLGESDLFGRRGLKTFKDKPSRGGGNDTFDCSPSGPCVACVFSEKKDEKYRCSETGYRIPLKCVKVVAGAVGNDKKVQKGRSVLENSHGKVKPYILLHDTEHLITSTIHRNLLDDSSKTEDGSAAYITYRSCIPAVNEEKLSVLGFEGIIFGLLLISGSAIFLRRKRSAVMQGVTRIPSNPRF